MIFKPGECAFIPYVMAGDPDLQTTRLLLHELARAGANAIELGVPYGDPLADGPTISAAGMRALRGGVNLHQVLELVQEVSAQLPPIVLFTYFNPVYQYGIRRFAQAAADAGAHGTIVPDVALEESSELSDALKRCGMSMPLLVAPSTPPERAAGIARAATGFVYVVSRLGVTGAGRNPDFSPLRAQVAMLRALTDKPLAVGFGISTAGHVAEVRPLVDGVIVGSALIDAYAGYRGEEAASRVRAFADDLLQTATT